MRKKKKVSLPPTDEARMLAAIELIGRAGATGFEVDLNDLEPANVSWSATAEWKGARVFVDERPTPMKAAEDLARKVLDGALCTYCDRLISVGLPTLDGCGWRRVEDHWVPGCQLDPLPPSPAPSERLGPGEEEDRLAEEMMAEAAAAPVLINDYSALVGAAGTASGEVRAIIILKLVGRVNKGTDEVTHTSLWSIDDAEAFAHLLLEEARIAREAGSPETWPKRGRR